MWHISFHISISKLKLIINKCNNTHELNDGKSQSTSISIKNLVQELIYLALSFR